MANTNLLPDLELLARNYLAGDADVLALVGTDANAQPRVYTRTPADPPATPYVRLVRLPTPPVNRRPLWLDVAAIQLDCYGGTQRQANRLAETVRRALDDLPDAAQAEGVVTAVEHGPTGYLPDPDLLTSSGNARERYLVNVTVFAHPDR